MLLNKFCLFFLFTHFLKSTLIHTIRNRFVSRFSDSSCESHYIAKIQGQKRFFKRFVSWEGETVSFRTIRIVNRKILTTMININMRTCERSDQALSNITVLSKTDYGGAMVEIGGRFTTCRHNMAVTMWISHGSP